MRRLHLLVPALVLACNAPPLEPLPDPEQDASSSSGGDEGEPAGSSSAAGDSTTGSGSDGPTEMPCDGACVAPLPAELGWQGPVVMRSASEPDTAPGCDGAWDVSVRMAFADIEAEATSCACECDASPLACPESVTIEFHGSDDTCELPATGSATLTPGCNVLGEYNSTRFVLVPPTPSGACTAVPSVSVPSPALTGVVALCGTDDTAEGGCDDGDACIAAVDGPTCVWKPGDAECPAASGYSERTLLASNFLDTRGCTPCTCGGAEGSCDVGEMTMYQYSNSCSGSNGLWDLTTSCSDAPFFAGVSYPDSAKPELVGGSCDPTPSQPTGELVASEPITVCCTPA